VKEGKLSWLSLLLVLLLCFQVAVRAQEGPKAEGRKRPQEKKDIATDTELTTATRTNTATTATQPTARDATGRTSTWPRYTNTQVGYTFQYPPDWTVRSVEGGQRVVLTAPDGHTRITFQVASSGQTLRTWVGSSRMPPRCIFKLMGGMSGARCFDTYTRLMRVYIRVDQTTLAVTNSNRLRRPPEFERVVSSVQSAERDLPPE